MLILSGTLLVLASWTVLIAGTALVGTALAASAHREPVGLSDVRRGLWWGLLVVAVASYLLNLIVPLSSTLVAIVLLMGVVLGLSAVGWQVRRRGWRSTGRWGGPAVVTAVVVALAVGYLALAALGPVTNYDSGLYHLGGIRYAAEYATIPGLANLYFPLGYGNAGFPLAALLENGPWSAEGFRLLNGLIITLLGVDLVIRSRNPRHPGFFVLLVGAAVVLVPMVALSDYWVTSPSQDTTVLVVTVVASGLLAEAIARRRDWVPEAATAAAVAVLLVMLRPTMAAFSVVLIAVVVAARLRRGATDSPCFGRVAILVGLAGAVAAAAAVARDYVLSGWLQYPLSVLHFDVPWLAGDPVNERIATLGYHRDPNDLWNAAEGWGWVGAWLRALPHQWEFFVVVLLLVAAGVVLLLSRSVRGAVRWKALVAVMLPSIAMTIVWWTVTPPSFRFAWGPIFTLGTIPLGWGLWRLSRVPRTGRAWTWVAVAGMAAAVSLVALYSAAFRFAWGSVVEERTWSMGVSVPYAVASITDPPVTEVTVSDDLTVLAPAEGEQCWMVFPLCTPRPPEGLVLRGDGIQGGFERPR